MKLTPALVISQSNFYFHWWRIVKGKVHPKNLLISDGRSVEIGKSFVDCFSMSLLDLMIFAFKVQNFVI